MLILIMTVFFLENSSYMASFLSVPGFVDGQRVNNLGSSRTYNDKSDAVSLDLNKSHVTKTNNYMFDAARTYIIKFAAYFSVLSQRPVLT